MMIRISRIQRLILRLIPYGILARILPRLAGFQFIHETRNTQTPISFRMWYEQKVKRISSAAYWPVHQTSRVVGVQNICIGIETSPGLMPGCYIQGEGKIYIGDYTQIGPNVGIISANHDVHDTRIHKPEVVKIGRYCWVGMNAVILPGVVLGDFTIVGAGSVVTRSFTHGYCVIGGNPARKIKDMDPEKCVEGKSQFEYVGYIPVDQFSDYRKRNLNL